MRIRNAPALAMAVVLGVGSVWLAAPDGDPAGTVPPTSQGTVVDAGDGVTAAYALEAFPSASLRDWVSYADHVSLFTVLEERQLPWGEHERKYGEGLVGREITVRVDQVLWRSPTAPPIPSVYTAGTAGWALKESRLSPMGIMGGPRLEVGERYLAAWIHSSQGGWEVLSVSAAFPVDKHGRVQLHEWSVRSPAASAFVGALPEQVSLALAAARPDQRASRYAHLEPSVRRLAASLAELPDRPGFLRASRERLPGSQVGYVREADWERLKREQIASDEIPFFDQAGNEYADDEGGDFTLDGFVLEE